jgi:hypothetical protein
MVEFQLSVVGSRQNRLTIAEVFYATNGRQQ